MRIQKLKLKPGLVLIDPPSELLPEFKSLRPVLAVPSREKVALESAVVFATESGALAANWKRIVPLLKQDAVFWVAYPKKSSGIPTDLNRMSGGWDVYTGSPWQPVASASISEAWTGIRFKYAPNLEASRRERPSENILDADGTLVVDRINRAVHPPKDLDQLLRAHPEARIFFDKLAFTHRKEYVLWIVEAKKQETRDRRLKAAIEMMVSARKNPSGN